MCVPLHQMPTCAPFDSMTSKVLNVTSSDEKKNGGEEQSTYKKEREWRKMLKDRHTLALNFQYRLLSIVCSLAGKKIPMLG